MEGDKTMITVRKAVLMGMFLSGVAVSNVSADVMLVYESADAVLKGQNIFGTIISEGVLISAEQALKANTKPFLGPIDEKLRQGILIRLDNDLNVALFRVGDVVENENLQKAHEKRAAAVKAFLPAQTS